MSPPKPPKVVRYRGATYLFEGTLAQRALPYMNEKTHKKERLPSVVAAMSSAARTLSNSAHAISSSVKSPDDHAAAVKMHGKAYTAHKKAAEFARSYGFEDLAKEHDAAAHHHLVEGKRHTSSNLIPLSTTQRRVARTSRKTSHG